MQIVYVITENIKHDEYDDTIKFAALMEKAVASGTTVSIRVGATIAQVKPVRFKMEEYA